MDGHPLKDDYPRLYNLSFGHNITVAEAIRKGWHDFKPRRTLHGETLDNWSNLKARCQQIEMSDGQDRVEWTLSVKSIYRKLIARNHKNVCGKLRFLL